MSIRQKLWRFHGIPLPVGSTRQLCLVPWPKRCDLFERPMIWNLVWGGNGDWKWLEVGTCWNWKFFVSGVEFAFRRDGLCLKFSCGKQLGGGELMTPRQATSGFQATQKQARNGMPRRAALYSVIRWKAIFRQWESTSWNGTFSSVVQRWSDPKSFLSFPFYICGWGTSSLLQDGEASPEAATWIKGGTNWAGKVWRNINESVHVVCLLRSKWGVLSSCTVFILKYGSEIVINQYDYSLQYFYVQ